MTHAIELVVFAILTLAGLVMGVIGFLDGLLAAWMTAAGIPPGTQGILLAVAVVVLVIFALRLLGRIFGALVIVLLVLLLAHKIFPGVHAPQERPPVWLHVPAQIHTFI